MSEVNFDDGQFIQLIRQYPLIWDRKDPYHNNKFIVDSTWITIAEFMNTTEEFCVQRWANIRHRFAKERRLAQIPSESEPYIITWPFYEACSFLEKVVVPRKTVKYKGISTGPASVESSPQEEHKRLWPHEVLSTKIEEPDAGCDSDTGDLTATLTDLSSTISNAIKGIKSITENLDNSEKSDGDLCFGRMVALMLKNIKGKKRKAMLKAKIITTIAEATSDDE